MAPGKEEEESASVTSCAAPDKRGGLVLLRLSSNHKNSQRRRRCSETGSGSGGEGPATSRVHRSVATGSQNETGWPLLEPVKNTRAEVVLFIELGFGCKRNQTVILFSCDNNCAGLCWLCELFARVEEAWTYQPSLF